jgi:predicted TIM-barrel fold metal-dependent hydrolase
MEPVIDMHVHAGRIRWPVPVQTCPGDQPTTYPALDPRDPSPGALLPKCPRPVFSPANSAALKNETIAELRRHNVRRAVLAGTPDLVRDWQAAAPGQFLPAAVPTELPAASINQLRHLHRSGRAAVFAELGAQYMGLPADDPSFAPFWALADELDVPVGIHLGEGMPLDPRQPATHYRAALTSPFQLESVLRKHPRLRIYIMHYGSPLVDETIAMLFTYPSLYVDVGANVWNLPRAQFYDHLRRIVDAGFSKRILFGSDQTAFPQGIGLAIRSIQEAPFLSADQKRDILYNNAARFLRLTKEQIAADHEPLRR